MKLVTLKKRRDFVLSNKHGQKTHNKNFRLKKFNGEGVSWDGYKGHVQTLADTGILVNK